MKDIPVKVNFKQLLEDINYTNKVMKTYDVKDIITRNQFYELKDDLVMWMLKHPFGLEIEMNGLEYTEGTFGNVELVKFIITYNGTECKLHQNLDRKMRELFWIPGSEKATEKYVPEKYDVEYDENNFREALSRMKVVRMKFKRSSMTSSEFWQMIAVNDNSKNPWMRQYLGFLPNFGKYRTEIVEE